jgi:hypothetical protein
MLTGAGTAATAVFLSVFMTLVLVVLIKLSAQATRD